MEVGKLTNEDLGEIVFSELKVVRDDILIRPSVGEDCSAVAFDEMACVISSDPITGSGMQLGKLAVHVCLNDIASSGADPIGLLLTVLCPVGTTREEIQGILKEANMAANSMDAEIIGGHTEITSAVNRIVISATAIGKTPIKSLIKTSGAKPGDYIYMTKQVATEGTSIIAGEKFKELSEKISQKELETAKALMDEISVVPEGRIAAKAGATAMHDATEGGVLGAIYELCEASATGCTVQLKKMTVHPVTEKICDFYNINPLKLIASGSMLICISEDHAGQLERGLLDADISYACIGTMTSELEKKLIIGDSSVEEIFETIESPKADELFKVIS